MRTIPIDYQEYTQEELLAMKHKEAIKGLNEKMQRFCECYVEGHNRRMSLIKAGYEQAAVRSDIAYRMLKDPRIDRYIQWLKARILNSHLIKADEVIDAWVRIAFSDMTDFVNIRPNSITLKPEDQIDGQLVKSIKSGRDGISIELHDKMKALEQLARYMDDMPKEWKQKLEERKAEILEQEYELKKKMYDFENKHDEDDGFIEAIKKSAESVWSEEE